MAKGGNAVRWTTEQLEAYLGRQVVPSGRQPVAKPGSAKFGNTKVKRDGEKFDSKKEARRWLELQQMERDGKISELRRQVSFELAPAVHLAGEARKKPALRYIADAVYVLGGQLVVEDTKSEPTRKSPLYRAKKHLMATIHHIHIREV